MLKILSGVNICFAISTRVFWNEFLHLDFTCGQMFWIFIGVNAFPTNMTNEQIFFIKELKAIHTNIIKDIVRFFTFLAVDDRSFRFFFFQHDRRRFFRIHLVERIINSIYLIPKYIELHLWEFFYRKFFKKSLI